MINKHYKRKIVRVNPALKRGKIRCGKGAAKAPGNCMETEIGFIWKPAEIKEQKSLRFLIRGL